MNLKKQNEAKKSAWKGVLNLLFFVLFSVPVMAQQVAVSGTILDETGVGLPGVNILEKGTLNGTITDVDGSYTLKVAANSTIMISFTGYRTVDVAVGNGGKYDVTMEVDSRLLDEVVVTGYVAQQKKDLTGAVGVVNTAELIKIPSSNLTTQLQGRVAGVTVGGDGSPGGAAKVRIRGITSFSGANDPLYIVDGVPTQDVSSLNPNDIENMSVLKDAGAASIYGSRAANGVILITTKRGQSKGIKVNYDMYVGNQSPSLGGLDLLNAKEYADLQWLVYKNDGTNEVHPVYGPSTNASPSLPAWAGDTDWFKVITRNAMIMNHDLSFSGGNENSKFYAGLNYFNQEGIIIENFYQRFSARLNSEFKIAKGRITIGENLTVTGRNGLGVARNGAEESPISRVYMSQPIIPHVITTPVQGSAYSFKAGDFGGTGIASRLGSTPNIFADLTRDQHDRQKDIRILGSMFMDVKLMEGLNFRSTFGGSYQNGYNTDWTGNTYERAENVATSAYGEFSYFNNDWVWTNSLTYNKTFDKHNILAVAGYEAVKYDMGRGLQASRAGYFSIDPAFRTVNNGAQITGATSYFNTPTSLVSNFLRADYNFDNKYYLSATVRRDGSSRFGQDFRYGTFPSVSAGIRLTDLIGAGGFLTDLKVRGGYGTMGNQLPVNPANQFNLFGGSISDSNYDLNGTGTSSLQGFRPTRLGNADTKWETQVTTNIGFDASLLDSKLQVSADLYRKKSQDLLVTIPLPAIYGAADAPALNVGDMQNTGIDLQLDYRDKITDDLSFEATLTFTHYKNEILKYTDDIDFFDAGGSRIGGFNRNMVGMPMSMFFGYQVAGLFQNQAEVDGAPKQDGAEAGFFRYEDVDGDKAITPEDRTFIGNPHPDFTAGLNLGLNYKNFDVSAYFFASKGNDIFNYNRWWLDFWQSFQNQKSAALLYDSWTPTRTNTNVPKASNKSNFSNNTQSVSYYVEDGSFLRLRTLQVGYTMPQDLMDKAGISKARVYIQGTNLFTLTGYTGIDPDVNNGADTNFGVDFGNYPLTRQIMAGLNVTF